MSFLFGFDDIDFSDRVLRLEITPLAPHKNPGAEKCRNWFSFTDSKKLEDGTDFLVQTFHVSSVLLAAKSLFFYKLFKNGMTQMPERNVVTLRINASEEAVLMDLLNFMYDNTLGATSAHDLVDVLMAAYKCEMSSCMKHCIGLLLELPMTLELALLYMELPTSVLMARVFEPLLDASKEYIAAHYKYLSSFDEEAMALPLPAIEAALGSDGLQVLTEDDVLDFILEWARVHCPKLKERRQILTNLFADFICLPKMSSLKLKEVVDCPDFNYKKVSKLVLNALFSKEQDVVTDRHDFPRRIYVWPFVKVLRLESVQPCCIAYFDLTKEECAHLFPSKRVHSQEFCLGGWEFFLVAECLKTEQDLAHNFGLFLRMTPSSVCSCTLDYEYAVMKGPAMEFQAKYSVSSSSFTAKTVSGLTFKWTELMSDESAYFIDGILRFRVQMTIRN